MDLWTGILPLLEIRTESSRSKMAVVALVNKIRRRLVMLRVGTTGAEPLRPVVRYPRRLLRPHRGRGRRVPFWTVGNDNFVSQPASPQRRAAIRELDWRWGDDENDADAEAQHELHGWWAVCRYLLQSLLASGMCRGWTRAAGTYVHL